MVRALSRLCGSHEIQPGMVSFAVAGHSPAKAVTEKNQKNPPIIPQARHRQ
jgi:hypothetical protein